MSNNLDLSVRFYRSFFFWEIGVWDDWKILFEWNFINMIYIFICFFIGRVINRRIDCR